MGGGVLIGSRTVRRQDATKSASGKGAVAGLQGGASQVNGAKGIFRKTAKPTTIATISLM